jgi:hypothetical protein
LAATTTCLPARPQQYSVPGTRARNTQAGFPCSYIGRHTATGHETRTPREDMVSLDISAVPSTTYHCDADSRDNDKRKLGHIPTRLGLLANAIRAPSTTQPTLQQQIAYRLKRQGRQMQVAESLLSPCKLRSNGAWKRWHDGEKSADKLRSVV